MNLPRLACTLATVLVPAGCSAPVPCDGPLCLSIADVSRVQVGVAPDALTIVDVDGDGARDLVGASGPAGTVTVLWGGDAGFAGSATTWSIDQEVAGIVVVDLDDDGRLDLATALPRADAVAVVRGRGGREFAEPERFAAGAVPRALIAAELDGQGPSELVTADYADGTVTVLHRLVAAPPLEVGPGPRELAAGDFDGDGHVDIAVALADADAVQLLHGDGHGAPQPAALLPVGAAPYGLVAADFDGDARLDLATADSLDDTVSVLLNAGAGEFTERTTWPTVPLPGGLVVVQPLGSLPVLGVLSETTFEVERLDPRTGSSFVGMLSTDPSALVADGAALFSAGESVSYLSPGTGVRVSTLWHLEDRPAYEWPVDLDGDGRDELLIYELGDDDETVTLRRDGEEVRIAVGIDQPGELRSAELTGDGRRDLLISDYGRFVVSVQQKDGSYAPGPIVDVEGVVTLADVDADGVSEVLVAGWSGEGRLDVMRSDATGVLTTIETSTFPLLEQPTVVHVLDGDGDDFPDLLLTKDGAGVYLEDARLPAREFTLNAPYVLDLKFDDLDRDGRLDAVVCDDRGARVVGDVLGAAVSHPLPSSSLCGGGFIVQLDDDEALEILTYTASNEPRFTPWNLQDGEWEQGGSQTITHPYLGLVHVELDGDPGPELLLSTSPGLVALDVEFGASLIEYEHVQLGAGQDLRFGDLDGDGAADLLAFGTDISVARADRLGGFEPLSRLWPLDGSKSRQISRGILVDLDGHAASQFVWSFGGNTANVADITLDGLGVTRPLDFGRAEQACLTAARIDQDEIPDLLVLHRGTPARGVLFRGTADGELGPPEKVELAPPESPFRIFGCVLHDMNRDGVLDIVALMYDAAPGIQVLHGKGDGTFAAGQLWSPFAPELVETPPLVAGDFDRDGAVELVTIDRTEDLVAIRQGGTIRVLQEDVRAYASADLDRDGRPELLATGDVGPDTRLHIGRSRSDGSFGFTRRDLPGAGVRDIQAADIDGDGHLEVILVDDFGATIVRPAQ